MSHKTFLMILDGWGIGDKSKSDAIYNAKTPFIDSLYQNNPNATLLTFGESVGLPDGQMGNSEVGHLNIGAGRVVYQDLVKINKDIKEKTIDENPVLLETFKYLKKTGKALHLMGLVSDGGVHSTQEHLHALIDIANQNGIEKIYIHAFTDGRDVNPTTGFGHLEKLENFLIGKNGKVATVVGRYYAMDRDRRWERIKKAYDLLVHGIGNKFHSSADAIKNSYENNITDEFIVPSVIVDENYHPIAKIQNGDTVLCFNFRTDRCREITMALTQQNFEEFNMSTLNLHYITMTNYDKTFKNVHVLFDKDNLNNTLGEVLSKNNKTQVRIAETEKYPHVTFFFSGGREIEFEGESRIMIPSPKVATYDLQPEMSAFDVKNAIIEKIITELPDFVCLNFANPDMVGHTGVYNAIVKAVETVDAYSKEIVEVGTKLGYSFIIIADHGNADIAINPDGSVNTAHTKNLVPVFLLNSSYKKIKSGKLADIAPTILKMMEIEIPKEMDGEVLI
jgi:2,3-bisphosphoglycerate-independent phosphoglycerate mutase